MSDFQHQLWVKMIDTINDYLIDRKITFGDMVFKLDNIINLAEIQNDEILTIWENIWLLLEATYADNLDKGIETKLEDVKDKVEKMRAFLVKYSEKVKQL